MNNIEALEKYALSLECSAEREVSMKNYTSFKVGGPAELFLSPEDAGQTAKLVRFCEKEEIPVFVLGKGSNLLVSDRGIKGAVIYTGKQCGISLTDENTVRAQSGASLAQLCTFALENSLSGLEFAYGIPGTVGGAVFMNAGAYGGEMKDVLATVQALEACKKELGVRTVLGVSNISFGLPCRSYLNTTFLTMAMYAGLDLAIMNPSSEEMMAAVYAYNVLTNRDRQSTKYIERYANRVPASAALVQAVQNAQTAPAAGETPEAAGPYAPLMKAVEKGLKGEAAARTRALLEEKEPLELVDEALIPALDIVGAKYEKGTLFLPQLLQAATAAQGAFEEIKTAIAQKGEGSASKGRIVLATVKGDVHDIGKNIVRVILENYGFEVLDLGRDVPVETVVDTVREKDVHLVGLSALMTTTLKSMEETIAALHAAKLDCKIMVGGAVLTPEYAEKIGADWYAKDAKRSADIAKEFFGV